MRDTSKYLVYLVNVRRRKDKFRRSFISFGDVCSEIEFTEACSGKIVISLNRDDILMMEVEDMEKIC